VNSKLTVERHQISTDASTGSRYESDVDDAFSLLEEVKCCKHAQREGSDKGFAKHHHPLSVDWNSNIAALMCFPFPLDNSAPIAPASSVLAEI